jgi:glycosyltransferase involved in cell wall biosynthesis
MSYWSRLDAAHDGLGRGARGVITLFPSFAASMGVIKAMRLSDHPVIAWTFNMGRLYRGVRGALGRAALGRIDRFVVYSSHERETYARWLRLPIDRFEFVHLHRHDLLATHSEPEEEEAPFLLAMGSARRDYRTLFSAVATLGLRTVVVASPRALRGLDVPDCVEVRCGLEMSECRSLVRRARLSIVPVDNPETASGQTTVVEALMLGRPVIATRCSGLVDYIEHGSTGMLTEPYDVEGLRAEIRDLWNDRARREHLSVNARAFALRHCTVPAATERLAELVSALS